MLDQQHVFSIWFCVSIFFSLVAGCSEKASDVSGSSSDSSVETNIDAYSDPVNADSLTRPDELANSWIALNENLSLRESGAFEWEHLGRFVSEFSSYYETYTESGYWFADEKARVGILLSGDDFDGQTSYRHYYIHDGRLFWQNWLYLKVNGSSDTMEGSYSAHCGWTEWESKNGTKRFEGWDSSSTITLTEDKLEYTWKSVSWETISGKRVETVEDEQYTLDWRQVDDFIVVTDDVGYEIEYVLGVVLDNGALNYMGREYDLESLDLDDEDLRFDSKDLLLENIVAEFGLVSAQN